MKLTKVKMFCMVTATATLALAASSAKAEELKFSAGVSVVKNLMSKIQAPFEKETGIHLVMLGDPGGNGSDQVFKDVDEKKADAGAGGVDWDSWMALMKEKHYTPKHGADLLHRVIGNDHIQLIANKGVGTKTLTSEQVTGLLTGAIHNWKEVGGADVPVHIVLSKKQPATGKYIEERFLGKKPVTKDGALWANDNELMLKQVAGTPGGLAYLPLNEVDGSVLALEHPQMGRPLTLVTIGHPSPTVQKLLDFIKNEGKKYGVTD